MQNKVLVAILENWQNVEKAINSANNSIGSAEKSNAAYLDSIEGRTKLLTSTMQSFWNNFISADVIKGSISLMTTLIGLFDKLINSTLGNMTTTTGVLVGLFALINKGMIGLTTSILGVTASSVTLDMVFTALLTKIKAMSTAFLASPLLIPALVIGSITAIIIAVDKFGDTLKNLNARIDETKSSINELQSEYESLKSKEKLTDEQLLYLKLLDAEIDRKKKSLALDAELLLQRQFLNKETVSGGGYVVETSSGIDKMKQSILQIENYKKQLQNINLENEKSKEQWSIIEKKILDSKDALSEQFKTLVDTINTIKEYDSNFTFGEEVTDVINQSKDVLGITDDLAESIDDLGKSFNNTSAMINYYKEEINSLAGNLKELEGIQDKAKDGYSFSYEEIEKLKKTYPELESAIHRTADGWTVETKALDGVRKSMIQHTKDQIQSEKENTVNTIAEIKKRLTARMMEAKSLSKLISSEVEEVSILSIEQPKKPMDGKFSTIIENIATDARNKAIVANRELFNTQNALDDIEKALKDLDNITMGRVSGGKKDKPKKDDRQFLESIDAEIRAIKLKNDNLLKTEKLLQEQLKLAKDIEGIEGLNEQYRINGEIIEHNKVMLESFKKEQDLVHARANAIRAENSKYDTTNWFDTQGEATVEYINKYNSATKKQQEEMSKLFSQIQALKKAWMESASEVNKIVDANKELVIQQDKLLEQQYELARQDWIKKENYALKERRDRLQALQSIEEAIVAIIRKRGEEEKKQLDDNHRAEMESLEERHKERKEKYTEELDAFRKMIQDKIDALDEQYEEEDYLEQLNKEREEANRLQKEIDVLSLDDSLTARNKTIELRKQLADQNDKIAKMQQKKERDTLKKSLQDQLKDKEKDAKDKESIADKAYENEKKRLEEDYKINKEFLDKKYADDKVYAEAKESIMRGTVEVAKGQFEDIYDAYKDFEDKFGKGMGILGDIIKEDFLDPLAKAQQAIEELKRTGELTRPRDDYDSDYQPSNGENGFVDPRPSAGSSGSGKLSDMSKMDYQVYLNMKKLYDDSKKKNDQKYMDYAKSKAQALRDKYKIPSDDYSYDKLKDIPWEELKNRGFKHGGKLTQTGTIITDVHGTQSTPEWIFNDAQLKNIVKDVTMSAVKMVTPSIPNVTARQGITLQIDNFIKADTITKDSIPELKKIQVNAMEDLKNLLNKNGVRPSLI